MMMAAKWLALVVITQYLTFVDGLLHGAVVPWSGLWCLLQMQWPGLWCTCVTSWRWQCAMLWGA